MHNMMHSIRGLVIWVCYVAGWFNVLRLYWQKKPCWHINTMRSLCALGLATLFLMPKQLIGIMFLPLFFYACFLGLHFKNLAPDGRRLSKKEQKEQIWIRFMGIRFQSLAHKPPPNHIHFFCAGGIYIGYAMLVFIICCTFAGFSHNPGWLWLLPIYLIADMVYWLANYQRLISIPCTGQPGSIHHISHQDTTP